MSTITEDDLLEVTDNVAVVDVLNKARGFIDSILSWQAEEPKPCKFKNLLIWLDGEKTKEEIERVLSLYGMIF